MIDSRISPPPMVGVPALATMWLCGPSSRIGWPSFCFFFSQRMKAGPIRNATSSAVIVAPPVRKVM